MSRHILTAEEQARGNVRKNARMKVFRYTDEAKRMAKETLRREIAEAKAEAPTATLFRWWPE
jgi:transcriptional/translational regulatory protein YebC/TACO1